MQTGQLRTLTRGALLTTWKYNDKLRLSEVTSARAGRPSFGYSYPETNSAGQPNTRGRVLSRTASIGRSWKDLSYDGTSQLLGADVGGGRVLSYSYDARGNRETQGPTGSNQQPAATHTINGLDQISGRTLTERGFGILGHVTPGAAVQVQTAAQPQSALNLNSGSGEFYGYWTVSQSGAGGRVTALVQGSLAGRGVNGTAAVAEEELSFVLPPSDEVIESDYAGRTKADGFWTYQWSDSGQLRRMIRKPGMFAQAGVSAEEMSFVYDADGRRTKKIHTLTFSNGRQTVEMSRVLWSGWLPVLEERSRNGQISARRWFLWGADLSGTLEGAGGIGGLVAIVEEKPDGSSRTLYPVQDGLGNVTAVLDAANGATVARFDYGPFGEPLGEYGDVEACPFRFQTKWYDRESEHYCYGYRYYSPRLGRWLSRDPLGEDGGVNLYAYCGNDPVNRHDPLGLAAVVYINNEAEYNRALAVQRCGDLLFSSDVQILPAFGANVLQRAVWEKEVNSVSVGGTTYDRGYFKGTVGAWFFDDADHAKRVGSYFGWGNALKLLSIGAGANGGGGTPMAIGGASPVWITKLVRKFFSKEAPVIAEQIIARAPELVTPAVNSGEQLYWHGSTAAVARRNASGIFVDGPGNGGLFWTTSKQMDELGPMAWKVGGNSNVQLIPPRLINKGGLEATYNLTSAENVMFRRAWGPDFNWNPYQWWKGAAGQFYYRQGAASWGQRVGELGKAIGITGAGVGGAYLLDKATE